jgi:hypothetical protein
LKNEGVSTNPPSALLPFHCGNDTPALIFALLPHYKVGLTALMIVLFKHLHEWPDSPAWLRGCNPHTGTFLGPRPHHGFKVAAFNAVRAADNIAHKGIRCSFGSFTESIKLGTTGRREFVRTESRSR